MAIRLDGAKVLQVDLVGHKGEARLLLLSAQHLPENPRGVKPYPVGFESAFI